eukprot:TRINITY_DN50365_c0_g1_i1.p1 TRINITY_DN50365_c0_g1~~TRINITY_DN50365_c0_g1_i1.p1  ORF type:complete len:244 (-),score=28.51 TRINITY_DN50365_c0_g1_i1:261-911(-)
MADFVAATPAKLVSPEGLAIARVSEGLVAAALAEVQPHLQGDPGSLASAMFEAGISYLKTTRACALRPAAPLADFPNLRALLEAVSVGLGAPADLREGQLNVICRRYLPGHGLQPHRDLPEMFEEDIFGCVLSNTSGSVLEFHRLPDGQRCDREESHVSSSTFRVDELPGTCLRQRGAARFEWNHGVKTLAYGERWSVTWRWIRTDSVWFRDDSAL